MTDAFQTFRTKRGLDAASAADLADLFHELSQNKETRGIVAKAVRKLHPDSPHAMAFKDVELDERFESFEQKQAEAAMERQRQDMLDRMNRQRLSLMTGGPDGQGRRYEEDDVKKIEALMQKKGITDYEDGATLYAATLPPVEMNPNPNVPTPHGATWEFPDWAAFAPDPNKAARDTATSMITDFMRKR